MTGRKNGTRPRGRAGRGLRAYDVRMKPSPRAAEVALLAVLGVVAVGAPGVVGGLVLSGLLLVGAAVAAGLVEARAARRDGRRRWVGAWAPSALAMAAVVAVGVSLGPQGPDSGLATSIVVAALAVVVPVFAVLTHVVAWIALRARPAAPPG